MASRQDSTPDRNSPDSNSPDQPGLSIPVYVICFPDPDQREAITERYAAFGITPLCMDAVSGAAMSDQERQAFTRSGREYRYDGPIRDGAMGCSLSHQAIWREMLDDDIPAAVVLEDDARPISGTDPSPATGLHRGLIPRLNDLAAMAGKLDVVFLSERFNRPMVRVDGTTPPAPGLAQPRFSDMGAESYFITQKAAAYLLSRPDRFGVEIDLYLHHWWRHDRHYHPLHHTPPLFEEDGRPTQIGYDDTPRYAGSGLHHRAARRFHRIRDSLMKRVMFNGYIRRAKQRLQE